MKFNYTIEKPLIIAGPCAVESEKQIFSIAQAASSRGVKYLRGGAFKPRTSPRDFQGLGDVGVDLMRRAADAAGMKVVTEILELSSLERHYDKIDVVQIGGRSMTSYGLLKSVGVSTAADQKPVLLKRGLSSTVREFALAAQYILEKGNPNVIFCLRGIRTFEQIDSIFRFTPDFAGLLELREILAAEGMEDYPVVFDPSHSCGISKYVPEFAKAALALGADGLLVEYCIEPEKAKVDSRQCVDNLGFDKIMQYAANYSGNISR